MPIEPPIAKEQGINNVQIVSKMRNFTTFLEGKKRF
jgi:hypothetical protein